MVDYSYIKNELQAFSEKCKMAVRMIMESDKGINPKVGKNTLKDSNIYNDLEVQNYEVELFNIIINGYIDYIEKGRSKGIFPPPMAIASWAQRKGLPSDNKSVYAYCMSIYKYGIAPRPIMNPAFEIIDEYFDGWADMMFERIMTLTDTFFNS